MPELPEVEVVRRGLQRWVSGRTIAEVEVLHPRAVRRHPAGAGDFAARLKGHSVGIARRRGKYLWLPLADTDTSILGHLGVTILMATHDAEVVTALRKRVIALEDGRIIRDETGAGYHRED